MTQQLVRSDAMERSNHILGRLQEEADVGGHGNATFGAAVGAGLGAAAGSFGGPWVAVVGAGVGALIGFAIGNEFDSDRARLWQ